MNSKKSLTALLLATVVWITTVLPASANVSVTSPSVILIESSTGQVIYEVNSTGQRYEGYDAAFNL